MTNIGYVMNCYDPHCNLRLVLTVYNYFHDDGSFLSSFCTINESFIGGIPLLFLVDRRSGTFMSSLQFSSPTTWLSTSSVDTSISTSLSSSIVGCVSFSVLFGFVISCITFIPSFGSFSSNVTLRLIIILFVHVSVCSSLYPFDRSL